jgi:hypothetical protein
MPVSVTNRGDVIAVLVKPGFIEYLIEHGSERTPIDDAGSTDKVRAE